MVGIKGNKKHTQTNKSVSRTDFQKHCLYLILQGREKGLSLHNTLYNIGQKFNANIPPDYSDKIRQLQHKNGFNLQTYIKKSLPFSIFIKIVSNRQWLFDCRNIGNVIK